MNKWFYDIECLKEIFTVSFLNYKTNKWVIFEISERKNEYIQLINFLNTDIKNLYLIGFNNEHYDNCILNYLLINNLKNKDLLTITKELRKYSDSIINSEFPDYQSKYYKSNYQYLDLFCHWSKKYKMSKRISLKSCGINLNHNLVKDMTVINDIDELIEYNKNDVVITKKLFEYLKPDILLKQKISDDIGFNCMNYDNIKIASKVLCKKLSDLPNWKLSNYDTWNLRFTKTDFIINDILKDYFEIKFELPIFQNLYDKILNQKTISEELIVNCNNTLIKLSYGIGGLHSVNSWEKYFSNETHTVITSDVTSLYPNLIINYKCLRFTELLNIYENIKHERIVAKKNKDLQTSDFLKLCLNGVSGLLDQEYNWLYYPEGALRMRICGQLILTKFIETCIINNWQVISVNTDGIEVIVPNNEIDNYYKILNNCAKTFNLELEHEIYNKIFYQNVNSYLAVTKNNKIKLKGEFLDNPPVTDSRDYLVISKALIEYLTKNISIFEFIKNHNNIYDFCSSQKISKDHIVKYNGIIQQRLNRYYCSKKGAYLYKEKQNKITHMNKESSVILANNINENVNITDYNIDYDFYIRQTQKYIDKFYPTQLNLF